MIGRDTLDGGLDREGDMCMKRILVIDNAQTREQT